MNKTNFYPKILITSFCVLLLFLGVYTTKSLEFLADNHDLRDNLISWAMNLKFLVLKDNFFSNIMYTRDHQWLNYTGEASIDDAQNVIPFTSEQLEIIHAKLSNIQQTLNERGIKFYLVIPPNKLTIYPDDLDRIAPKHQPISRLDQLIEFERIHTGLNVIDIRSELLEAKKSNQVFYSTDTHWNDYGSWIGYTKMMSVISKDFPAVIANPIEKFNVGQKHYSGDLASMSGNLLIEETTHTFSVQTPREVKHDNTVSDSGVSVIMSYIDDPELPVSLVFRDSFYTHLHGYMSQHFSKSVCLWSFIFDYEKVDEVQPDLVIVEIAERYIDQLLRLP